MTLNPIPTSLQATSVLPANSSTVSNSSTTTAASSSGNDVTVVSPLGQFAKWLHQLSQNDPAEYAKVTAGISNGLQKAGTAAQNHGYTTLASELNDLSSQFAEASKDGHFPGPHHLHQAAQALQTAQTTTGDALSTDALSSLVAGNGINL